MLGMCPDGEGAGAQNKSFWGKGRASSMAKAVWEAFNREPGNIKTQQCGDSHLFFPGGLWPVQG